MVRVHRRPVEKGGETVLADMAEKAIRQVKATVNRVLGERMGVERAEQIV
jgi:hypothetical protein